MQKVALGIESAPYRDDVYVSLLDSKFCESEYYAWSDSELAAGTSTHEEICSTKWLVIARTFDGETLKTVGCKNFQEAWDAIFEFHEKLYPGSVLSEHVIAHHAARLLAESYSGNR